MSMDTGNTPQNEPKTDTQNGSSTQEIKHGYSSFTKGVISFLKEILDIREKTDKIATIKMIKEDIAVIGHTAWILVCSIMIASIGLNANSTAVVIGAMLISPLMGPILGIGLSIAINDIDTLNRSLKNFGVMVGLSILTAFLFFFFFPLREESSELLSRTYPDIRDVLIAFFGGLALIIARTKKGTIASVIFGVAIATALMPPLCTAGFGLAIGNFSYFFGAMYLFTINTIFIALATYLILKLLRFPMVRYVNSGRRKRIGQLVSATAFLVMLPAIWTFYNVFQKSLYLKQANDFITEKIETTTLANGRFINNLKDIDYKANGESTISLVFMGDGVVTNEVRETWLRQMQDYGKLKNTKLDITQGAKNEQVETTKYIEALYENTVAESANKDETIRRLQEEIKKLTTSREKEIPFNEIITEAKIIYDDLQELGYYSRISSNFSKTDTTLIFTSQWKPDTGPEKIDAQKYKLSTWLEEKLKLDTVTVIVN